MVRVLGQLGLFGMPTRSVRAYLPLCTPCQAALGMPSPFLAMAACACMLGWPGHNQMGTPGLVPSSPSLSPMAVQCTSKNIGIMFLSEVALGKSYRITSDDSTLCQPPAGYDSVLACGQTEPGEPGAGAAVGSVGLGEARRGRREARSWP